MDDDFDRFLEASNDDEESFLQPARNVASRDVPSRSPVRGGSPSYRGSGDGYARKYGGGYRSSDPLASIDLSSLPIPDWVTPKSKGKAAAAGESRGRAEPSSSPTVRSGMRQSSERGNKTPSAKSEPSKTKPSPTHSDSESSVSHGHSEGDATGAGAMASIFANFKAEMEQQLRESAEEQKRQEEERERKKIEEEERRKKEAEEEENRLKELEARKKREAEEAERKQLELELQRKEEENRKRVAAEAEARRLQEEKEEEEKQKKRKAQEAQEAAEAERKQQELRQREAKEAEIREERKKREEAAEARQKQEEEQRMKEIEESERRIREEAEAKKARDEEGSGDIPKQQLDADHVKDAQEDGKDTTSDVKEEPTKDDREDVKEVRRDIETYSHTKTEISDVRPKASERSQTQGRCTKRKEDELHSEEAAYRLVLLFSSLHVWSEQCRGNRRARNNVQSDRTRQSQVCRTLAETVAVTLDRSWMLQVFACWSRFCAITASSALDQVAKDQLAVAAQQVADSTSKNAMLLEQVAHLQEELAKVSQERDVLSGDLEAVLHKAGGQPNLQEVPDMHSRGDTARLEADLQLAEKMLRACEKENENLANQNRQLRQGARLRREEVDGRQLQLVAELNAAKASADVNPASMARLADLERELAAVKERADEHAKELERCREAKRQLEREVITGPLPKAQSAELEQAEARLLQSQGEVSELQAKLVFYAQGQQEMEEDRRQVLRLGEELRAALGENAELRKRPAKEAGKKIAELRKQNEELHECLRKRHPDSLLALIKACEPPLEEKRKLSELKGRVVELEAQLAEQDALYDRRIRALRAQYDHMRHEYERRASMNRVIEIDEPKPPKRAAPDREAVLQARIKDLERQVEHTKSYYLSKLRKREPLVPSKDSKACKPAALNSGHGHHAHSEARHLQHIQQLQMQLQAHEDRIEELLQASASPASPPIQAQLPDLCKDPACSKTFLRLFLASPEAFAMLAFCAIQRWLVYAARPAHAGPYEVGISGSDLQSQVLRDAETQAGLDHRLPWNQLLAVLARAGVPGGLLDSCCQAAPLDFSVSLDELRQLLQGTSVRPSPSANVDITKALARLQLSSRDGAFASIHQLDSARSGFVQRSDFTEALRALPCALSAEERQQVASLFTPPGDLQWVCYPLFLQCLAPDLVDEVGVPVCTRTAQKASQATQPTISPACAPSQHLQVEKDLLNDELSEAKAASTLLRGQLKTLEARCEKQALQVAELSLEPGQIVRRLQGEVAFLESRVLEQQAAMEAGARKAELSLRAELDVKSHEVLTLRRTMEARENEVRRYQQELEAIIAELSVLRGSS